MNKYRLIGRRGEGTFSEVLKAQSVRSGKFVAIKCMKNTFDHVDQVNNLREIQALRRLAGHPNIIKLHEVLYDEPTGRLALVFELMDLNLYEAIKGRRHYLPEPKVKQYMYELLKALDHMHRNGIFHRDVKPENLLLADDEIKLADLGSCRGIYSRQPYTEYISTRWYRAPECLLTDGYYNFKMDLFAAGCVWFEIAALFPLFPGQNEMDQIQKIHNVLGTPDPELLSRKFRRNASHMDLNFPEKKGSGIERLVPHVEPDVVELIKKLIKYDPDERLLARQALKDPYFRELREADKERNGGSAPGGRGSAAGGKEDATSPSGSTASVDPGQKQGQAELDPEAGHGESPTAAGGGLPNIRERRKQGAAPGNSSVAATSAASVQDPAASQPPPEATGGGGSEGEDADDGNLLPPIGGAKGKSSKSLKRDNKAFKAASTTSLQKSTASPQATQLGSLSNSKGFNASLGAPLGGAPSAPGHSHLWAVGHQEHARSGMSSAGGGGGGGRAPAQPSAAEKMSSTWAAPWASSHQPRKYVSPFRSSKKR